MYKQPVVINEVDFADWQTLFSLLVVYVTPAATVWSHSAYQLATQLETGVNMIGL